MTTTTIADEVASALRAFEDLLIVIVDEALQHFRDDFQRQFERFQMWVGNIGAHRKVQSSLDFRLRDASHISATVHNMLERLHDMLRDTRVSLTDAGDLDDESDDDLDDEFRDLKVLTPAETLENILNFVSGTVKSLLRISMAIQNPAPQDRYLSAKTIDTSYYEQFDVNHVQSLYRNVSLPEYLVERLGKANTSRRQFLKYSEAHRKRLASGVLGREYGDTKSTIATPLPAHMKQPKNEWEGRNLDEVLSQTTVNTTAPGAEHMDVVPFPEDANYDEEFACPLCCCIVLIKDWKHWKSHQFRDLQPYVCIYDQCLTGSRVYGSRHEWEAHLAQHIETGASTTSQLTCLLCNQKYGAKDLHKHVAWELQKLSLFVVPSHLFEGAAEDDDSSSAEDVQANEISGPASEQRDDEDDSVIRCICGLNNDDGNIVLCDNCSMWQHIRCYYPGGIDTVPDKHFCGICRSKDLDEPYLLGVDPEQDPELARALRLSFEEEKARQEREKKAKEDADEEKLEGISEGDAKPEERWKSVYRSLYPNDPVPDGFARGQDSGSEDEDANAPLSGRQKIANAMARADREELTEQLKLPADDHEEDEWHERDYEARHGNDQAPQSLSRRGRDLPPPGQHEQSSLRRSRSQRHSPAPSISIYNRTDEGERSDEPTSASIHADEDYDARQARMEEAVVQARDDNERLGGELKDLSALNKLTDGLGVSSDSSYADALRLARRSHGDRTGSDSDRDHEIIHEGGGGRYGKRESRSQRAAQLEDGMKQLQESVQDQLLMGEQNRQATRDLRLDATKTQFSDAQELLRDYSSSSLESSEGITLDPESEDVDAMALLTQKLEALPPLRRSNADTDENGGGRALLRIGSDLCIHSVERLSPASDHEEREADLWHERGDSYVSDEGDVEAEDDVVIKYR